MNRTRSNCYSASPRQEWELGRERGGEGMEGGGEEEREGMRNFSLGRGEVTHCH